MNPAHAARILGRTAGRLGAALLSALLLGAYSLAPGFAFLPYVALVPWVLLYTTDRGPRVSIVYYVVAVWVTWILDHTFFFRFGWWTAPAMATIFFIFWVPFAPVLQSIHRRFRLPRTVTVPIVWVAFEWVRAFFTLAHFDLFRLGYSQARFPSLIQIADVTGVYGISFLVAAVNGLLADSLVALRDARWRPWRAARAGRVWVPATCVGAAFALAIAYGGARLSGARFEEGPSLAIVQPNVGHERSNMVSVHLTQVLMTERGVPAGAADLIVWPENAILDNLRREGAYLEDLKWQAGQKRARMLVGAMGKPPEHPGRTSNAAFLVEERRGIVAQYDKQLLFPWSEYIPFDRALARISTTLQRAHRTLSRMGWGFLSIGVPGERMVLFDLPWNGIELPFATLICFENTYPPIPAEAARMGARFFVNITSEGTVGGTIQEQLLRVCILRAVENRVAYVRAGNTGISCFIDPAGRVEAVLRGERGRAILDRGVLIRPVALSAGDATLYARSRDAFAKACVAVALLMWAWSWLPSRRGAVATALLLLVGAAGCASPPALGEDPHAAPRALAKGRQLFASGRPGEALAEMRIACADASTCARALEVAAACFVTRQAPESGADFFEAVAERHPRIEALARGYRAYMLEKSLRAGEAEVEYRRSLEGVPTARVHGFLGNLLLRSGRLDEGIEVYRAGIERFPDSVHLRYLLGRALCWRGDLQGARPWLESVIEDDPGHGNAWSYLGRIRRALGSPDAADAALRKAIEVEPRNIQARFLLAGEALRAGDRDRARTWLREIREIEATLGRGPKADD